MAGVQTGWVTRSWGWLIVAVCAVLTGALYWPALTFALTGDDYQWVQHAHHALHRPHLLFADLATFYRPLSTWTLVADHVVWGWSAFGHRVTNLSLHAAAAALLVFSSRRLGLGRAAATAVALIWGTSVFASEAVVSVAIRFQNLLFLAWLGVFAAWPREGEPWTRGRRTGAIVAVLCAMLAKESWVTTPMLVFALSLRQYRGAWRRAVVATMPVAVLAALYVGIYFSAFPSDKSYYDFAGSTLLKLPQMLAAFWQLEDLVSSGFDFSWRGALSLGLFAAVLAYCCMRRLAPGLLGALLMAAAILPTLWVPYLPLRYTAIPFAGFLLLVVAGVEDLARRLGGTARQLLAVTSAALVALMIVTNWWVVRLELLDWQVVAAAHEELVAEARKVVDDLPGDPAVIAVRAEKRNPYLPLANDPQGLPKLWFVRSNAPYGLVEWSALFEWAAAREELLLTPRTPGKEPALVLVHEGGGFRWAEPVTDARREIERLRDRHLPVVFFASLQ